MNAAVVGVLISCPSCGNGREGEFVSTLRER
jgi:uncharacterized protein (DUF983 family)